MQGKGPLVQRAGGKEMHRDGERVGELVKAREERNRIRSKHEAHEVRKGREGALQG